MGEQGQICIYIGDSTLIIVPTTLHDHVDLQDLESLGLSPTIGPLNEHDLARLVNWLEVKSDSRRVTLFSPNVDTSLKHLTKLYTPIAAAGGVVKKEGKAIMIKRLGVWDLPKGKIEKGESSEVAAVREVEEECGVVASLGDYLCSTYHTYPRNGKLFLKQTFWYSMVCTDDSKIAPQVEEDIEEVKWMDSSEVEAALRNSYGSIREVWLESSKK